MWLVPCNLQENRGLGKGRKKKRSHLLPAIKNIGIDKYQSTW